MEAQNSSDLKDLQINFLGELCGLAIIPRGQRHKLEQLCNEIREENQEI